MKFKKNKSFNAIIITKKKILLFLCLFVIASVLGFISSRPKTAGPPQNQYTLADTLHGAIIENELHQKSHDKEIFKKIISSILGFDITNPETILYDYSPLFSEVKEYASQKDTIYPQPLAAVETKEKKEEEKPIAEISASKGMAISNSTDINIDTKSLIAAPLPYTLDDNGPQVLIVHTHTTESYTEDGKTKYTASDSDRSTDENKNMIAVGKALYDVLNRKGISCIHDTTVHDYPAYNGSYNRSKATVLANLEKYPSIKIVLDLHRDGIVRSDGTKVKVACEIDGKKASQCMFVVGTDVLLEHNNWRENMKLACKIQNLANEMYPNLMRPINVREERFNQQLSKGAVILEVGSNGNTLNESVYSAELIGNVIAKLFGK